MLVVNGENGGVFAQIIGTKMCVSKKDWALCAGVIVNKLKGSLNDFFSGLKMLEQMTGKKVLAIPFLNDSEVPKENGVCVEKRLAWEKKSFEKNRETDTSSKAKERPVVVVVAYPHSTISDELYPLEQDQRFCLEWRRKRLPKPYPATTAIILPDSRLTMLDLKWLQVSSPGRTILVVLFAE